MLGVYPSFVWSDAFQTDLNDDPDPQGHNTKEPVLEINWQRAPGRITHSYKNEAWQLLKAIAKVIDKPRLINELKKNLRQISNPQTTAVDYYFGSVLVRLESFRPRSTK